MTKRELMYCFRASVEQALEEGLPAYKIIDGLLEVANSRLLNPKEKK